MTNHISESQKIAIACLNRWPGPKSTWVLLFSHFRKDSCFAIKWHPLKIKCISMGNLCAILDTSFLFYFNRNSVLTMCSPTNVNLSVTLCVVDSGLNVLLLQTGCGWTIWICNNRHLPLPSQCVHCSRNWSHTICLYFKIHLVQVLQP